jgi:hypothetical protein
MTAVSNVPSGAKRQCVEEGFAARRQVQIIVEGEGRHIAAAAALSPKENTSITSNGRINMKKKKTPAGASSRPVTSGERVCVLTLLYAALKRAMISARKGLVSVAAAPNSSGDRDSAAG